MDKFDIISFLQTHVRSYDIVYINHELKNDIDSSPYIKEKIDHHNMVVYVIEKDGIKKKVNVKYHFLDIEQVVLVINKMFIKDYDSIIYNTHNSDVNLILESQLYVHSYKSFN